MRINGNIYIAEDTGIMTGNRIDIYVPDHNTALQQGVYESEVFIQ